MNKQNTKKILNINNSIGKTTIIKNTNKSNYGDWITLPKITSDSCGIFGYSDNSYKLSNRKYIEMELVDGKRTILYIGIEDIVDVIEEKDSFDNKFVNLTFIKKYGNNTRETSMKINCTLTAFMRLLGIKDYVRWDETVMQDTLENGI